MAKQTDRFLEVADVARELGVTGPTVKDLVAHGKLSVAALTLRGVRLFARGEVERVKRERAQRAAAA